jgi:hypothetical protein
MGGAAVAAIKGATLRFVRESEKQRKGTDCQREVARVRPDGQVDYQDFCRGEKQVLVDVSHDDTKVSERDAKLVKPGMYVITTNDAVLATWAKGATHPSSVFGVELK